MTARSGLDDVLFPGLPVAVAAELEERLERPGDDAGLARFVQDSPVLLLALLGNASLSHCKSGSLPEDAFAAWRQLGSRRARGLLRALALLLPQRPALPRCDALTPVLRARIETLLPLCASRLGPAAITLLRLVELVPLRAELAGEELPPWRSWGLKLSEDLGGEGRLHPLLTGAATAMAHPVTAGDSATRRHAALLQLALATAFDPRGRVACDAEVWTLLDLQPWNLDALAGAEHHR